MGIENCSMTKNTLPWLGRRLYGRAHHYPATLFTRKVPALLLWGAACIITPVSANDSKTELWPIDKATLEFREQFKLARQALAASDIDGFNQHKAKLTGYALYRYLEYEALNYEFRTTKPSKQSVRKLNGFEAAFGDEALTRKLTRTLQQRLAATEQWALFLGVSKSRVASTLSCSRLRAEYELGRVKGFTEEVLDLWIQPKQHNPRCQPVLDAIEAKHTPPIAAIWQRIFESMDADKPEFARSMLPYLASYERKQVTNWINALEDPKPFIEGRVLREDNQLNRRRYADLILAWSKKDPVAAMENWLKNKDRYRFYKDRYYDTHRLLAMRGAYRRLPEAYDWLMSVPARKSDLELKEWRVRTALFAEDWPNVVENISRLPAEEKEKDHWAYWEARAFEKAGKPDKARVIYEELAELQSYHGFLSADRINVSYAIRNEPVPFEPARVAELARTPSLIRAREYHHTGVTWESRREWYAALIDAKDSEIAAATQLASHWNMPDRAIATAGRVKEYRRAIEVRFPVMFEELVTAQTDELALDPSFVYGLMRRESAFMADAKSPVGATGLMQLMPNTAKHVASLKGKKNWRGDLTDPEINIEFGSFYFRHVLDRFDEREVLAAAAYNAGPHRVSAWLPKAPMAGDVWVDTIPYSETRRYVRALLAYAAIYDVHLTGEPKRLSERLDDIQPPPPDDV